jgi:hypothetical protein
VDKKSQAMFTYPPSQPFSDVSQSIKYCGESVTLMLPFEAMQKRSLSTSLAPKAQHAPHETWLRTEWTQPGQAERESKKSGVTFSLFSVSETDFLAESELFSAVRRVWDEDELRKNEPVYVRAMRIVIEPTQEFEATHKDCTEFI